MKTLIQNLSLHVEQSGEGDPTLVFLHYWGGSSRTWNRVISKLQHFQCVAYDMRGWGQSSHAGSINDYSIAALADEAGQLIDKLKLTSYILVGHSMGGKVAQLLASRRTAGLKALVLVAPATPTPAHFPAEAREQQIHAYDNRETVLQTIGFLTARLPSPEIVEQIIEDSLSGAPEAKRAWPETAILEDISGELAKISVPTLVLAGEHDRLDSIDQHRREILPRIVGSRLHMILGSGHLIPIDEPEQLAQEIETFAIKFSTEP